MHVCTCSASHDDRPYHVHYAMKPIESPVPVVFTLNSGPAEKLVDGQRNVEGCQEPPINLNVASVYNSLPGGDQPYSLSVGTLGIPISMADDNIIISGIMAPKWAPIITGEIYGINSTISPARVFVVDNTIGSGAPLESSTRSSANQWSENTFNGTAFPTETNNSAMRETTLLNFILTGAYDNFTQSTIGDSSELSTVTPKNASTLLPNVSALSPTTPSYITTTASLQEREIIF
uniref:Uncharacterized protein n=1 Tax=Romanomermis culicivorax TaxID=13658 RepID=A0A915IIA9_ROMCU